MIPCKSSQTGKVHIGAREVTFLEIMQHFQHTHTVTCFKKTNMAT